MKAIANTVVSIFLVLVASVVLMAGIMLFRIPVAKVSSELFTALLLVASFWALLAIAVEAATDIKKGLKNENHRS